MYRWKLNQISVQPTIFWEKLCVSPKVRRQNFSRKWYKFGESLHRALLENLEWFHPQSAGNWNYYCIESISFFFIFKMSMIMFSTRVCHVRGWHCFGRITNTSGCVAGNHAWVKNFLKRETKHNQETVCTPARYWQTTSTVSSRIIKRQKEHNHTSTGWPPRAGPNKTELQLWTIKMRFIFCTKSMILGKKNEGCDQVCQIVAFNG